MNFDAFLRPRARRDLEVAHEDMSHISRIATAMRMVVSVNILGLPSCAGPVGCDDGLPQGVQHIGARFREALLLDAAQAIEDRAPLLTPIEPRVARGARGARGGRMLLTIRTP